MPSTKYSNQHEYKHIIAIFVNPVFEVFGGGNSLLLWLLFNCIWIQPKVVKSQMLHVKYEDIEKFASVFCEVL